MGRSITPTFRVETQGTIHMTAICWNSKTHGRATAENLARYIEEMNASFQPGGVNAHVGAHAKVTAAQLIRQSTDEVVATWEAS